MRGLSLLFCPLLLVATSVAFADEVGKCADAFLSGSMADKSGGQPVAGEPQTLQMAKGLLEGLPLGAGITFQKQSVLKPAKSDLSPEESWQQLAGIVVDWAKTNPRISFAHVADSQLLFAGGEFAETPPLSGLLGKLKTTVIVGNGSSKRPQHWILEFSQRNGRFKNEVWQTRVVISTTPSTDVLHIFAESSHYYTGVDEGRDVGPATTYLKFFNAIKKNFVRASDVASDTTDGEHRPESISVVAKLSNDLTSALKAHVATPLADDGSHPLLATIREMGSQLKTNGFSTADLRLSKKQKEGLELLRDKVHQNFDVHQLVAFYRALEEIGFEIPDSWKHSLSERLKAVPYSTFSAMPLAEIESILVLFRPVKLLSHAYKRPLARFVLSRIEDELFHRLASRPKEDIKAEMPGYFRVLSLVSFNLNHVIVTPERTRLLSAVATDFVMKIELSSFNDLAMVLLKYRAGLTSYAEARLSKTLTGWLAQPKSEKQIKYDLLTSFVLAMSQPSAELVQQLSSFFLSRLNQQIASHTWVSNFLHTLWLLNPKYAVAFARELDESVIAKIGYTFDGMVRFREVAQYLHFVSHEEIGWLNDLIAQHSGQPVARVTSDALNRSTDFISQLQRTFVGKEIQGEQVIPKTNLTVDGLVPTESLVIMVERPWDPAALGTSWKWSLARYKRENELLKELGYEVLRLGTADIEILARQPDTRYRQIATPNKPMKKILTELLNR